MVYRSRRPSPRLLAFATVAAALAAAPKAQAGIYYWLGGANDFWSVGFSPQAPASAGDNDLIFGYGSNGLKVVDSNGIVNNNIADNFIVRSMEFVNQDWTLAGKKLRFGNGGNIKASTNVTASTAIQIDGAFTAQTANSFLFTITGVLSGAGSLFASGGGNLTLSAANTYTGATTITAGTLTNGVNNALTTTTSLEVRTATVYNLNGKTQTVASLIGAGSVTLGGGSLSFGNGTDTTFTGTISGTGSLVKAGTGTFTASATNTYSGGTTVNAGRFIDPTPHNGYVTNATLEFSKATDYAYNLAVTGTGAFVKSGAGILTLNGLNSYAGATTVSAGTIANGVNGTLPTTTALTVNSGAKYDLMGKTQTIGSLAGAGNVLLGDGALTIGDTTSSAHSGVISGTGTLTKVGAGTLTLSGINTYSGGTTVSAGRLVDANPHGTYVDNAALEFANTDVLLDYDPIITGTGSFTKSGNGTLRLNGLNTYAGGTTTFGYLVVAHPFGTYVTNGTLDFQTSTDLNYALPITGTGGFAVEGPATITLSGVNTYAGQTTVFGGGLIDLHAHGTYRPLGGSLVLYNDADLNIGSVQGGGSLTKKGTGTLTMSSQSRGGTTTVAEGRLVDLSPSTHYITNAALELSTASTLNNGITVSGTGSLTKTGTGTITFTGGNDTYTGGTLVSAGRLITANPHGAYVTNAALEFKTTGTVVYTLPITGTGSLTTTGIGGNITVSGINTYTGGTTANSSDFTDLHPHGDYIGFGRMTLVTDTDTALNDVSGTASGSMTKGGLGTLTVNASHGLVYTGVNQGRLIERAPNCREFRDGAELEFSIDTNTNVSTYINGSGSFTKSGTGVLTLSLYSTTQNSYQGSTTVTLGTLRNGQNNLLPNGTSMVLNKPGVYDLGGYKQTIGSLSGDGSVLLGATGVLTVGSGNFTGGISDAGSLVKTGAGTLTLSGASVYTGGTTVTAGRLVDQVPHGDYIDNATLEFQPTADRTYAGVVSGTGALVKSGTGTLTLSGVNTYSGGTTVTAGSLVDQNPHGAYVNNANLTFAKTSAYAYSTPITGTGSFAKTGAGTLTLSGTQAYGGATKVGGGILALGASNVLPSGTDLTIDTGATFGLSGKDQTVASLSGQGAVDLGNGGNLIIGGSVSTTFSGTLSGTGAFAKNGSGTLTLTKPIAPSVTVKLNAGVLKGSTTVFTDNVTSFGGTLQFDQATDGFYAGTYSGSGALLKTGSRSMIAFNAPANTGGVHVTGGSLAVADTGKFGGGLTVDHGASFLNLSGGDLKIDGRSFVQGELDTVAGSTTVFSGLVSGSGLFGGAGVVRFNGGYSPGNSPASVTIQGDMNLGSSNDLTMELGGTTLGTGYDHLNVLGTATLGGNLNIAYYNGFSASLGQSFDLFDFNSSNGAFASINLPTLAHGLVWNTSGLYSNGVISVQAQAVPEPASFAILGISVVALLRRRRK